MHTQSLFERICTPLFSHPSRISRTEHSVNGKRGTTIFNFIFDNGKAALMAGDRMTISSSSDIHSLHSVKVHPIGNNVLIAGCGLVSDIQLCIRSLKHLSESLSQDTGQELTAFGKAKLFRRLLELSGGNLEAQFLLAGYDLTLKAFVRNYENSGACYAAKYFADGSGGREARGVLDNSWDKNMNQEEAIQLAVRAMLQAGKRNTWTANPFLSPFSIHIMSTRGIYSVPEKIITTVIERERVMYEKRHRDVQEQEEIL